MSRRRRGRSAGTTQEFAPEPRYVANCSGMGHGTVVGGAAGRGGADRLHGGVRQVLRGTHAVLQP